MPLTTRFSLILMLQIKGTCSHWQTLVTTILLLNKIILLMGQMRHCNLSDCPINQVQSHTSKCQTHFKELPTQRCNTGRHRHKASGKVLQNSDMPEMIKGLRILEKGTKNLFKDFSMYFTKRTIVINYLTSLTRVIYGNFKAIITNFFIQETFNWHVSHHYHSV